MKMYQIGHIRVPYTEKIVCVSRLAFYANNPRIYSQFSNASKKTQSEIQEKLTTTREVRKLREKIERDTQVNEPLWCAKVEQMEQENSNLIKEYKYVVLEGNSRLAAVKTGKDGQKPRVTEVPCNIFNFANCSAENRDSFIVSLLSQFHVTGKSKWRAYEVAGYIYRRSTIDGINIKQIAAETGKSEEEVSYHLEAFNLILKHDKGKRTYWSYYYEYAKIPKRHRGHNSKLDNIILPIHPPDFGSAPAMRDGLKVILDDPIIKEEFLHHRMTFREAWERVKEPNNPEEALEKLKIFQNWIIKPEARKQIKILQKKLDKKTIVNSILRNIKLKVTRLLPVRAKKPRSTT